MPGEVTIDTKINIVDAKKNIKMLESELNKLESEKQKTEERFSEWRELGAPINEHELGKLDELNSKIDYAQQSIAQYKALIEQQKNSGIEKDTQDIEKQGIEAEKSSEKIKKLKNACNKASTSVKKMGKSAKNSGKSFSIGFKNMLKYAFGIRTLEALFDKLRHAIKEGIDNLAQFNNGANPTNTALSNLKSSLTLLKNSLATAFSPILTIIEPALTRLMDVLSAALNKIAEFMAALTGASTFNKAVKVQENYAKSLNNTASAAKKAKNELYSFDELNVVKKDENSGSGGVSPNKMFETVNIESSLLNPLSEVRAVLSDLGAVFQNAFSKFDFSPVEKMLTSMKSATFDFINNLNFDGLGDGLNRMVTNANPLIDKLCKSLSLLYSDFLLPIATFTINDMLPEYLRTVADAMLLTNQVLDIMSPSLEYLWNKVIKPIGETLGSFILDRILLVRKAIDDLVIMLMDPKRQKEVTKIFDALSKAVELTVPIVKIAVGFLNAQFKSLLIMVVNIIGHVIDVLYSLIEFIESVFAGDAERAWKSLLNIFSGIANIALDAIERLLHNIIYSINSLSFDVPDWVPGFGGQHFGFNLPEITIPRIPMLATGTVVPRQSREFAAILGDNNRETEVVSPLSTMKQAMMEALTESGYGNGGDVYISADGDLDAIVRLFKFKIEKENKRVGRSFEKVVTV